MKNKPKYFDIKDVMEEYPDSTAYVIVGQRGVGKSYSIKKYLINHFIETGKKFVYVRRWTTDINGKALYTVFADVLGKENFNLPGAEDYKIIDILPKSGLFWVVGYKDENAKPVWLYEIGRITCISNAERFKGGTYNDYDSIFFDEFITERGYIDHDNEPQSFNKILNTVARAENDKCKVFLAGNPDSQIEMCPYLYDMKLDYDNMKSNTIYAYNTLTPSGEIQENTKVFVKLAELGTDYLNLATYGIWGVTGEDIMAVSGSVKINHYIQKTEEMDKDFEPAYEIILETAIMRNDKNRKKIYIYPGFLWKEPVLFIENHHREFNVPTLYSRYEASEFQKRIERQIYRLHIPQLNEYSKLKQVMSAACVSRNIITKDDMAGTIFETIAVDK